MDRAVERPLELGLDTFGDGTLDDDGHPKSDAQVLRDVVEQGVLADEVGVREIVYKPDSAAQLVGAVERLLREFDEAA